MVNSTDCRVCGSSKLPFYLFLGHSGMMRLLRFSVKVSLTLNNASEATSLFIYKVYFAAVFPLFIASFQQLSIEGVVVWILFTTNTLTPSIVQKWLLIVNVFSHLTSANFEHSLSIHDHFIWKWFLFWLKPSRFRCFCQQHFWILQSILYVHNTTTQKVTQILFGLCYSFTPVAGNEVAC